MCRNGWKYSVVLQMAEVFVIHMALKVHPQGLRKSVCVCTCRRACLCVDAFVCVGVCVLRFIHSAEDAINACC